MKKILGFVLAAGLIAGIVVLMRESRQQAELQRKAGLGAAFAARDWDTAENLAKEWIAAEPDNAEARIRLANVFAMQGDPSAAMGSLDEVPETYEEFHEVLELKMNLAIRELHSPGLCETYARQILKRRPRNAEAQRYLLNILTMQLRLNEILVHVFDSIRSQTDLPDCYVYLLMLDDFAVKDGHEVTEQWLVEGEAYSVNAVANLIHSLGFERLEYVKDSTPELSERIESLVAKRNSLLVEHDDDRVLLRSALADAVQDGDVAQAGLLLAKAFPDCADEPFFWYARAWAELNSGATEVAAESARKAIALNPLSWKSRSLLTDVYRQAGDVQAAEAEQKLASEGARLRGEIRKIEHVSAPGEVLLKSIAVYAQDCKAWDIANGLHRRLIPGN